MKWTILALAVLSFGCDSDATDAEFLDQTLWQTQFVEHGDDATRADVTIDMLLGIESASGTDFSGGASGSLTESDSESTALSLSVSGSVSGDEVSIDLIPFSGQGSAWMFRGKVSPTKDRMSGAMSELTFPG